MNYMRYCGLALVLLCGILHFQPVFTLNNPSLYFTIGMLVVLWAGLGAVFALFIYDGYMRHTAFWVQWAAVGASVAAFGCIAFFLSGFLVEERSAQSGLMSAEVSVTLPKLDAEQVSLVSYSVAKAAMRRKLGEDLGLGSQFEIGAPVKQVVNGRLVWAAPLEPRSTFKAWFGDTSPAYAVVDASDASSAKLVKADIRISNREFFSLHTRAWFRDPFRYVLGWYFELDDTGKPYWIGPVAKRQVWFRGVESVGVLVVDVNSAKQTYYPLDKVPAWVDNRFPANLVEMQINVAGELVNGWFNPSDDGKFKLSAGLDLVLADGQAWYLGTLSSIARDEAITEAVMISTTTKEVKRFSLQGITEYTARGALAGKYPEKQLEVSNPVPYLVNGIPAYVAALADKRDVVRAYGVIAVADAQVLAVSETLDAAVKEFSTRNGRQQAELGGSATDLEVEGVVAAIRQDVSSGQYFVLVNTGTKKVIAMVAPHLSDEVHVTVLRDVVKLKGRQAPNQAMVVTWFDNLNL